MHPHFSGDVSQDPMAIGQLNTKHGIGKSLDNRALNFNDVFFSHARDFLLAFFGDRIQKKVIIFRRSPLVNSSLRFRQNIRFVFRHRDGVLEMG